MNHAQLTALGRALRVLGEHGEALSADTPDARLHEVMQGLLAAQRADARTAALGR